MASKDYVFKFIASELLHSLDSLVEYRQISTNIEVIHMKKIIAIFSALLLIFLIKYYASNACYGIHLTSSRFAKHKGKQIMEYICDENIDNLKKAFCTQISSTHDLDSELNKLINFIDGKISPDFSVSEGGSLEQVRSGKTTLSHMNIVIRDISTDSKKYEIIIAYIAADDEKDKIGIEGITIFDITQTDDISKLSEDDIFEVGDDI